MALIEVHADLSRCAAALERIADVLEERIRGTVRSQGGPQEEAQVLMQTDADFAEIEEYENRLAYARGTLPGPDEDIVAQMLDAKDGRE